MSSRAETRYLAYGWMCVVGTRYSFYWAGHDILVRGTFGGWNFTVCAWYGNGIMVKIYV